MPLSFNIRHLEHDDVVLQGELTATDLELDTLDEVIQVAQPVRYDLVAEKHERSVLVRGSVAVVLRCECVRCLKGFEHPVQLDEWTCLLPLEGEDRVTVCDDCVDLTPQLREDIVLALPQHPLCEPDCRGLYAGQTPSAKRSGDSRPSEGVSSAWAVLNKLKF